MKINNQVVIERVKTEALKFVLLHGVKGWNMSMLAAKAGMSKDTLYRMFSSKEQLMKEILIDGILEYQNTVENLIQENRPYTELLPEVISHFTTFVARLSTDNIKAVLLEFPAIEEEFSQSQNRYYNSVLNFLENGKSLEYFRRDLDTGFLVKVFNAYTLHSIKYCKPEQIEADLKQLADYLVQGIMSKP